MKKLLLVDGYAMMFRAFYAVKFAPMYENRPIGAVFGCGSTLLSAIESFDPDYLIVAFDAPTKTFRHEMDENYKAQRVKAPDEFVHQLELVFELITSLNILTLVQPGYEADDIIGTLAKQAEAQDIETFILSGDLDFLQLISDKVHLAKFNGKEPLMFDRTMTHEKLGIYPEQIVDYKAIAGDSSDNYKGVPGIGAKGASALLTEYQTLDSVYENLEHLKPKVREKLETHKEQALHCQKLAAIHTEVPLNFKLGKANLFVLHRVQDDFF